MSDTRPWGGEDPGIVHGPSWFARTNENDTAYEPGAWRAVCEEAGLVEKTEDEA